MLELDAELVAALEQNHEPGYRATAFYGAERTIESVPLTYDGSLSFVGDAQVQGRGSVYLADSGESMVPVSKTDPLAPFGQELVIERTVTVGEKTWGIPMGRFRITELPSTREFFARFPPQRSAGWVAELSVQDRFESVVANDFVTTEGPQPGNSVWDEIQRLASPYPIFRSLPDASIPAGVTYRSRIDALEVLMAAIGGVPHMMRNGTVTARPADAWLLQTDPVATVRGVIDMDDSWSMELFNQVQVKSSVGGNDLVAFAQILDDSNPLSVNRPIGGRTYRYSSPLLDTQEKVDAAAATVLARVSTRQSKTVNVKCLPRPDLELGDFIRAIDEVSGLTVTGEVASMRFQMDPTADMTLELIAAETR